MTTEQDTQCASEISQRISQLESLSGDSLKGEMQELKKAIMENPSACLLLKEEDIGQLVTSLRKITGVAIATAAAKTRKAAEPKAKKMTAAEIAAAFDEEF
jgi:hypothetical protein